MAEAAKRLSLPKGTLKNWVYADKQDELVTVGKHRRTLTELELELSRVKRELAEVIKMETVSFKVTTHSKHNLPAAPNYQSKSSRVSKLTHGVNGHVSDMTT